MMLCAERLLKFGSLSWFNDSLSVETDRDFISLSLETKGQQSDEIR